MANERRNLPAIWENRAGARRYTGGRGQGRRKSQRVGTGERARHQPGFNIVYLTPELNCTVGFVPYSLWTPRSRRTTIQ